MNTTDPYSPIAARERQREARDERRQHRRKDDPAEDVDGRRAEGFRRFLQVALHFEQRRLHRAHDERQADQRQRDVTPSDV